MDIPKLMERAQEAARKRNFDYAVTLYHQILAVQPDHGTARGELRQVLLKRAENRKISPVAGQVLAAPQWAGIVAAKLSKQPSGLINACERYLQADPGNRRVNWLLARALEQAGHLNSAVAVYEFLHQVDPNDTETLKRAGLLKYRRQDIQGALEYYEKVLAINPRDAEAEKMRRNLAAEGTLASGSYTTARSSRELIKEKDEAMKLQREERLHKTAEEIEDEIRALKERVESAPSLEERLKLANLLVRKKDFAQARQVLEALRSEEPDSFEIGCRIGDLEMLQLKEEEDQIRLRMEREPSEALQAEAEAIQAFQQAVKDPRHKVASLHALGRLFLKKGLLDLSGRQLEAALDASGGISGKTKQIAYDLGRLAERRGDAPSALDWYLKIFEIDINYKDVASKIEALKQET